MTDIILVTYNRLEFTKQVIESIIERTKSSYRLIVVDNASEDGSREYLMDLHTKDDIDVYIQNDENEGLEQALQRGLQEVKSKYFVTVDNDCIAPELNPCWLKQVTNVMDFFPDFGAVALRPQVLIGVGPIFDKTGEKTIVENNVCGGSYRVMRTDLIKKIGGWTKKFENDGRGNEEHDICSKIKQAGFKVGYFNDVWTYHMFGEEGTWGYEKASNYKMGRHLENSPKDQEYNLKTCEPLIHSNE